MSGPKTPRGKIRKDLTGGDGREDVIKHMHRELGLRPPLKGKKR
ncbi:MAG: hypothetical protein ABSD81_07540 [Methanomicrobiales archaeon]|jgi:hypothetical protein